MNFIAVGAGALGLGIAWAISKGSKKTKKCRLPTNVMIMQANQSIQSGNPQLVQAVMTVFETEGCPAEAQAMRDWITQHGYNPSVPIVAVNFPMPQAGPGEVVLQPGEVWRAAALLGGVGCAIGLGTIRDKIANKGFSNVEVYAKNPGWGSSWNTDSGFLECTRYIQATVIGNARKEKKPSQVYRLERISVSA